MSMAKGPTAATKPRMTEYVVNESVRAMIGLSGFGRLMQAA
jgi:hypothetical protein